MWAKAKIPPTRAVNLWLGADLMVEYPIDEAQQLLVRTQTRSEAWGRVEARLLLVRPEQVSNW